MPVKSLESLCHLPSIHGTHPDTVITLNPHNKVQDQAAVRVDLYVFLLSTVVSSSFKCPLMRFVSLPAGNIHIL